MSGLEATPTMHPLGTTLGSNSGEATAISGNSEP